MLGVSKFGKKIEIKFLEGLDNILLDFFLKSF